MTSRNLQIPASTSSSFNTLEQKRHDVRWSIIQQGVTYDGRLDTFKMRYNDMTRELWELRVGIMGDPLVLLPREVWEDIFKYLVGENDRVDDMNNIFNALSVSKLWSRQLLASPALWTRIIIDNHGEDELAKIAIYLELSNPLHLELVVWGPHPRWEEIRKLLLPHSHRIRAIDWRHSYTLVYPQWVEESTHSLRYLPALERVDLQVISRVSSQHTILSMAPNLTNLSPFLINLNEIDDLAGRHVTHATIDALPGANQSRIPNTWNRLAYLNLYGRSYVTLDLLKNLHRNLVSVSVTNILANDFARFLSYLPRDSLQYLSVSLEFGPEFSNITSTPALGPLRVHSLSMNLMITAHETNRETETIWALCMASDFMPSITMLELSWLFPIPATALVTLESLPFLRRLSLRGIFQDYSDISKHYCLLPTLQTLIDRTYIRSGDPSTAQPLRAPNLKSLFYEPNIPLMSRPLHESRLFSHESYTSLTRLSILSKSPITLELKGLPGLEELEMGSNRANHHWFDIHETFWQSDLIVQLAREPSICPLLRTIKFLTLFLEWDILIYLLERRIVYEDSNLHRIEKIGLGLGSPHIQFLAPLSALLAGVFFERLPLEEYSIMAIARQIAYSNQSV
ncbi:hypothetical protein FRB91_003349 [Serendipita sp. 411]|nr:hypothetical protein FRB91_003349 [Serendipita sp. 411]